MSALFEIRASTGTYTITIEAGGVPGRLQPLPGDVIVTDEFFSKDCSHGGAAVIALQASESIKSLENLPWVIERLRQAGATRKSRLIAVGGGTIQDLCAFTASVYMRGVEWVYFPTTLLSMVDSCIGGKSSINVGKYKNLVGTFHPPSKIGIDPAIAQTLSGEQQASGLIEAAKICYCHGAECFRNYLACNPRPRMDMPLMAELIERSLLAKKWFVETDEFDQQERLLLNFGHTFGHAIEGASGYMVPHGIAVGLGILCALAFVRLRDGSDAFTEAPGVALLEVHIDGLVRFMPGLSLPGAGIDIDEVMERFEADKKHTRDCYALVLVATSGRVVVERLPKSPPMAQLLRTAITSVLDRYVGGPRVDQVQ